MESYAGLASVFLFFFVFCCDLVIGALGRQKQEDCLCLSLTLVVFTVNFIQPKVTWEDGVSAEDHHVSTLWEEQRNRLACSPMWEDLARCGLYHSWAGGSGLSKLRWAKASEQWPPWFPLKLLLKPLPWLQWWTVTWSLSWNKHFLPWSCFWTWHVYHNNRKQARTPWDSELGILNLYFNFYLFKNYP